MFSSRQPCNRLIAQSFNTLAQKRQGPLNGNSKCFSQASGIQQIDYYSVLKISPNASQKQVKAAYYKQSLILHPDRNIGAGDVAHEKFAQLTEAYKVLGNQTLRKEYDRKLKIRDYDTNQQQNAVFREDVMHRHGIGSNVNNSSRQYDTWTRLHYQNALQQRDTRAVKDELRTNISREESQQQSWRFATIFLVFSVAAFFGLRNSFQKEKVVKK